MNDVREQVLRQVEAARDELVAFTTELVRVPTVNPPGSFYEDGARVIGERLARLGYDVEFLEAEGRPEHTRAHPRVNVIGARGGAPGPCLHFNSHFDVVPPGDGWTLDPFAGLVRDGRIYGRGTCDMKAGLAASIYAVEAIRRAGVQPAGTIEISGTVDEESGGYAGVAWLCERGRIARGRTDYVIIPEPFGADRICIGHRGVWWFDVTTHGRIAHGSMPYLGVSAIEHMGAILEAVRQELKPKLEERRTAMPVVPEGSARATINVNTVVGGQAGQDVQTPCVADRCTAIFDRRFLIEEGLDATRIEMAELLESVARRTPGLRYEIADRMVVHPVLTPIESPLVGALRRASAAVAGAEARIVASPGTYDHKHVTRIGGITDCVAYGPGPLEMAHQPDEWCGIDDIVRSAQVMALATLELSGTR